LSVRELDEDVELSEFEPDDDDDDREDEILNDDDNDDTAPWTCGVGSFDG
jgi:hypothetical protein